MISKKKFSADGSVKRFLSDFIIRSSNYARPYCYYYDNTLNPDGSEDVLQDVGSDWSFPDNLYKRGSDGPKSEDLVTVTSWQIVDNSILFFDTPLSGSTIWTEVATTSEEFGETLTAPSVERAEAAADSAADSATAARVSETNAAASETAAGISETNASASETAAEEWAVASEAASDGTNLASIPTSNALAGTTALTNTVNTLVFDAITYTGTGASNDIVTGMESCDLTASDNGNGIKHDRAAGDCIIKDDSGGGYAADGSLNTSTTDAVPTMTSNTSPSGIAFGSNHNDGDASNYKAFDGSVSSLYRANVNNNQYCGYVHETPVAINKFTVSSLLNQSARAAKDFKLQASNNTTTGHDGDWTDLVSITGETSWSSSGEVRTFTLVNDTEYKAHRIYIVSNNGDSTYIDIPEIEFIEALSAGEAIESGDIKLDVPLSMVHIKDRDAAHQHFRYNGMQGATKYLSTDSTNIEYTEVQGLTSFNSDGFTVGTNVANNGSGDDYIAYQTIYTHLQWGLTNHGKRYVVAYNPKTNEVLPMWIGSGLAGHKIPSPVGVALDYIEVKNLDDGTNHWNVFYGDKDKKLILNLTNTAVDATKWNNTAPTVNDFTLGADDDVNTSNNTHVGYGKAKSETWTIVPYTGTGVAGNFVETKDVNGVARKPRRVVVRRVDSTGDWAIHDTERDTSTGNDKVLYYNYSNAEDENTLFSIDILSSGFILKNTHAYWNASGGQYIALVYFDSNSDGGGSYDDLASDTTQVNIDDRQTMFTKGFVEGKAYNTAEYNTGTETITPNGGWLEGNNYLYKVEGGDWFATLDEPNFGSIAYGHSLVGGKWVDYDYVADGSTNTSVEDSVPTMTSDTAPSGLVTYSTYSGGSAWSCFKDANGEVLYTATSNVRLGYGRDEATVSNKYSLTAFTSANRAFKDWKYQGSNDTTDGSDGTWDDLDTVTGETSWGSYEKRTFTCTNGTAYKHYRVLVSANNGDGTYMQMAQMEMIEAQLDSGTALTTPITYHDKVIEVAVGEPVDTAEFNYPDTVLDVLRVEEVRSKNQCTAWVAVDATTTPVTLRDGFNHSDVVSMSTGVFRFYFESRMDNTNYVAMGSSSVSNFIMVDNKTLDYVEISDKNYNGTLHADRLKGIAIIGGKE